MGYRYELPLSRNSLGALTSSRPVAPHLLIRVPGNHNGEKPIISDRLTRRPLIDPPDRQPMHCIHAALDNHCRGSVLDASWYERTEVSIRGLEITSLPTVQQPVSIQHQMGSGNDRTRLRRKDFKVIPHSGIGNFSLVAVKSHEGRAIIQSRPALKHRQGIGFRQLDQSPRNRRND